MADQISDQVYAFDTPTGWRVDTPDAREVVFEVGGLTRVDERRLQVARQHFTEAGAADFDQEGKDWVDRHTGVRHRLVYFDPTLSDDPRETGVTTFFVTADEHLVYLRPVGSEGHAKRVVQGTVGVVDSQ